MTIVRLTQNACSTRVPRVQFGVPPTCGRTRRHTFTSPRHQKRPPSRVSGATPETTRGTRVLQLQFEQFRFA
jgi:hypothetical protein